jgi:6-pyruvoyltetrahydropterin/6-carboxytetrahydropterin synthase
MIYVTRRAEFCASHLYHNPALSSEENRRLFGKCNNPYGHGHNYTVEVTVAGSIDPVTGMVLDLKDLKTLLDREVVQLMDHKFLNKEVLAFAAKIPTTENIAVEIWKLIAAKLTLGRLHRIRVYETPDLFVDYYGE